MDCTHGFVHKDMHNQAYLQWRKFLLDSSEWTKDGIEGFQFNEIGYCEYDDTLGDFLPDQEVPQTIFYCGGQG